MKRLFHFVPFLALVSIILFSPSAAYACPWYDPLCTPTPTPTPTPVLIQKLQVNPNIFQQVVGTTNTPTPTPTSTPTPTPTSTPTPTPTTGVTSTVAPSVTVTPSVSEAPTLSPTTEPTLTATPTPQQTAGAGLTNREKIFAGVGIVVLVILIATNWGKIKSWLHNKTA